MILKNKNISSIRLNNRLKRTNIFFNRKDSFENNNKILFPKFYFQYNRDIINLEKNIYNELIDFIQKEVEFKVANKITFDEASSEAKSSSESLNNISNPMISRTYSRDKLLNFNIFSPHSSSNFSHRTVLSSKKKTLKILPISNLISQQKSQTKQISKKINMNENKRIKLKKGPGKYYSIRITNGKSNQL